MVVRLRIVGQVYFGLLCGLPALSQTISIISNVFNIAFFARQLLLAPMVALLHLVIRNELLALDYVAEFLLTFVHDPLHHFATVKIASDLLLADLAHLFTVFLDLESASASALRLLTLLPLE